ncbi:MAG: hypothetical protein FWC11_00640 [Firmicutes bacterium]|nr:hypothetical protein [Bacillota bacterium]
MEACRCEEPPFGIFTVFVSFYNRRIVPPFMGGAGPADVEIGRHIRINIIK